MARIKKAFFTLLGDHFAIKVENADDMEINGNIVDHEYSFERGGDEVAQVSKRWVAVRDSYGIEIAPGQDDTLILACTVCIDQMS